MSKGYSRLCWLMIVTNGHCVHYWNINIHVSCFHGLLKYEPTLICKFLDSLFSYEHSSLYKDRQMMSIGRGLSYVAIIPEALLLKVGVEPTQCLFPHQSQMKMVL